MFVTEGVYKMVSAQTSVSSDENLGIAGRDDHTGTRIVQKPETNNASGTGYGLLLVDHARG